MVSTPEELAEAADLVRADLELDDVLAGLGQPHLVGSAALGLMVWPDLDITVVCGTLDVAALCRAASDLMSHPRVRQLTLRNDSGAWNSDPGEVPRRRLLGDRLPGRAPSWNIDIWFVSDAERQPDLRHVGEPADSPRDSEGDPRHQASVGEPAGVWPDGQIVRHLHGRARRRRPDFRGVRPLPADLTPHPCAAAKPTRYILPSTKSSSGVPRSSPRMIAARNSSGVSAVSSASGSRRPMNSLSIRQP